MGPKLGQGEQNPSLDPNLSLSLSLSLSRSLLIGCVLEYRLVLELEELQTPIERLLLYQNSKLKNWNFKGVRI